MTAMQQILEAITGRAVLAPMAGITDRVFRSLCAEYGSPFAVTEMVSAKGFVLSPNMSYGRGLLDAAPGERLAVQLFGHEPDIVARAAELLSSGPYCMVDLNMGCPAPKIVRSGEGSALMRTPNLAQAVARAVVKASSLPVSVKMRLGWDESSRNHVDFAKRMEDTGIALLSAHGRTREKMYAGEADWDAIGEVARAVNIPVIANGDVRDAASFRGIMATTGCCAAMVGRGALGNPFIFREIAESLNGTVPTAASTREKIETALRHAHLLCEYKEERIAIAEMRKHVAWYIAGIRDAAALRSRIHRAETYEQIAALLEGVPDEAE